MKADRQKVRLAMERAHMTVRDVAKAADLPPQTTAAIICGMSVQPDTLARIAQALDVGMADIAQGIVLRPAHRAGGENCMEGVPPELPAGQVRVDAVRFAEAVARSGLSFKRLAELAGVTSGTVRSLSRGGAHKAATVEKLADALGVASGRIIERKGNI